MKKSKRSVPVTLVSIILLGLILFGAVYYAWDTTTAIFQPANPTAKGRTVSLEVTPGDTTAQIADKLAQKGLIRNPLAFRLWARIKGLDTHLQAGIYDKLSPSMTISEITDQLLNAQPDAVRVVIPEGFRIEQIARRLANSELAGFKMDDFLKYTKHIDQFPDKNKYPFLQMVPDGESMEGFLFPASYPVPVNATARDVVNLMLTKTSSILQQNHIETTGKQHGLSLYQVYILASIVEREARFEEDRPGIASVYWNRVNKPNAETVGREQADPTVQYARDTQNPPQNYWLPLNDVGGNIAADSPWNTYTHDGLPPTPICSPGLASLQAAAAPPDTGYYYFLNKKDGHAVFAKDKADFDKLVQQYLPN